MKEIMATLKSKGNMLFKEGATIEEIFSWENDNISLPKKYKEWLQLSDGGELYLPAGVQLYGVSHMPIIDIKEDDRPDESYVMIGALASGDPILYKKGSEEIFIYNHEDGVIEDDEVYDDFELFLKDLKGILGE